MLYFFTGTDTETLRKKLNLAVEKAATHRTTVRITDAHSVADLEAALGGAGLFGASSVVILDNLLSHPELGPRVIERVSGLSKGEDIFFLIESAPDAVTRKLLEKHAEKTEKIDLPKKAKQESIFGLANALQRGQKKDLWVGYQREIAAGKAPEAIHGVLFWAAKQLYLKSPTEKARQLVVALTVLPHEARRQGFELEYALEHFVLSRA